MMPNSNENGKLNMEMLVARGEIDSLYFTYCRFTFCRCKPGGKTMIDWKKMKDDITRGIKDGAETVAKKTGEISAEGQKKIKAFNLKRRIQGYMEDLGGALYNVETKTPGTITDEAAKKILMKIEIANSDLKELE